MKTAREITQKEFIIENSTIWLPEEIDTMFLPSIKHCLSDEPRSTSIREPKFNEPVRLYIEEDNTMEDFYCIKIYKIKK